MGQSTVKTGPSIRLFFLFPSWIISTDEGCKCLESVAAWPVCYLAVPAATNVLECGRLETRPPAPRMKIFNT